MSYCFYNKLANMYENPANSLFYSRIAKALCTLLDEDFSPQTILELGAGTGLATQVLRRRFPKADILSTDPSIHMLNLACAKQIPGVKYIALKAEEAPCLKQKFDLIFGNFCYHWFVPGTASMLKQCLTPHGLVAFSIPVNRANGFWGNKLLVKIYRTIKSHHSSPTKSRLNSKHLLSEFIGFKLKQFLFSFTEIYSAREWANILRSRGSWHYLFGPFEQEAEKLWQEYMWENTKAIPLQWHVVLMVGSKL